MSDINNLGGIHTAIDDLRGAVSSINQKLQKALQVSFATVFKKSDDCSIYWIKFGDEATPKKAVLAYNKEFYIMNSIPKKDDRVVVIHDNQENAHILFTSNIKDPDSPPGKAEFENCISSSKTQ